jgi:hypothetical protein
MRKPSAYICTNCYAFHISNRKCKAKPSSKTPSKSTVAEEDDELLAEHEESDNNDEDETVEEESLERKW